LGEKKGIDLSLLGNQILQTLKFYRKVHSNFNYAFYVYKSEKPE